MNIALQDWMKEHGAPAQAIFVRDEIARIVGAHFDYEDLSALPRVIGEHVSKSRRLPVYSLAREDLSLRLVMRDNFYNWKVSVTSAAPITAPELACLFHTTPPVDPGYTGDELAPCYFEGFPREFVYGYYSADPRRFSANICGDYAVWAAIHAIMRNLGAVTPPVWHTAASHRAELDAARAKRR